MERKEKPCQPPEYPAEMFAEYFERAKERAIRISEIEAILGDDYDLDRLRELVEADRDGRVKIHPKPEKKTCGSDVREKLVELVKNALRAYGNDLEKVVEPYEFIADFLIHSGVTVQDGKPLDAFLHPVDAYKGLKAKYLVFKADTGERVGNCFVLRPDKDPAAVEAIRAYARATDNETLAEDIYNWVGKGEPVQEWISVEERLPDETGRYLAVKKRIAPDELGGSRTDIVILRFFVDDGFRMPTHIPDWINEEINEEVTHWMPLPQPPKGE